MVELINVKKEQIHLPLAILKRVADSNKLFELVEDFTIFYDDVIIFVPKGFHTDGASIPWYGRFWIKKFGKHTEAAVVHDYYYANAIGTRTAADRLFYDLMIEYGVKKMKARVMYWAVRIGGKGEWDIE